MSTDPAVCSVPAAHASALLQPWHQFVWISVSKDGRCQEALWETHATVLLPLPGPLPSPGSATAIHCPAPLFSPCWPTEPYRLVSCFLGRTNESQKDAHAVKISILKMKAHWKGQQKWYLNACGSKALCWKTTVFHVWYIWPRKTEVSCLNQKTALHTGGLNGLQIFHYWQCKMLCDSEVAEIYLLGSNACGV